MRQCPFPGCPEIIQLSGGACETHYWLLTDEQRWRMAEARSAYDRGHMSMTSLRVVQEDVLRQWLDS